jgi:hypothetical protein
MDTTIRESTATAPGAPGDPQCGWFDQLAIAAGTTPAQLGHGKPPA